MKLKNPYKITNCARCGGTHPEVYFWKFARPPKSHSHWAICPKTHQPILMRFTKETEE